MSAALPPAALVRLAERLPFRRNGAPTEADSQSGYVPVPGFANEVLSRVVGKHCESGDIVVRDCWLPADLAPGDLLAVAATGAYCYSMASSYNRLPRPAVVAVREGGARVLLRRETEADQFRLEVGQ